jgi:hypothetical protein
VTARAFARWTTAALALAAAGCATESLLTDTPKAVTEFAIAPYEIHEECARLAAGDRVDYRFTAQAPVTFHIYYTEGITFVSPISRDDVLEFAGIFQAKLDKRYCLQWEAGQRGALLDYRIRLLRGTDAK